MLAYWTTISVVTFSRNVELTGHELLLPAKQWPSTLQHFSSEVFVSKNFLKYIDYFGIFFFSYYFRPTGSSSTLASYDYYERQSYNSSVAFGTAPMAMFHNLFYVKFSCSSNMSRGTNASASERTENVSKIILARLDVPMTQLHNSCAPYSQTSIFARKCGFVVQVVRMLWLKRRLYTLILFQRPHIYQGIAALARANREERHVCAFTHLQLNNILANTHSRQPFCVDNGSLFSQSIIANKSKSTISSS